MLGHAACSQTVFELEPGHELVKSRKLSPNEALTRSHSGLRPSWSDVSID
jgi:hypothetical protein